MITLLWIIYILDCLLLIGIILLQPGEGADLAAAFGGASSQTAFGARGSATFLQKLTTGLAVLFMVLSILLVIITNSRQRSIMDQGLPLGNTENTSTAPAKPAAAEQQKTEPAAAEKPAAEKEAPAQNAPAPSQEPAQNSPAQPAK
jgi:preprotein translocase subunit SecG